MEGVQKTLESTFSKQQENNSNNTVEILIVVIVVIVIMMLNTDQKNNVPPGLSVGEEPHSSHAFRVPGCENSVWKRAMACMRLGFRGLGCRVEGLGLRI